MMWVDAGMTEAEGFTGWGRSILANRGRFILANRGAIRANESNGTVISGYFPPVPITGMMGGGYWELLIWR